jgi:hypothetical protein
MKFLALLALTAAALLAADATGTWKGTFAIAGGDSGTAHMVLKQSGASLTGSVGPSADEQHPILNGKAENGKLTFEISFGEVNAKFALNQEGDAMKGEAKLERDGQTQVAKLDLKRE